MCKSHLGETGVSRRNRGRAGRECGGKKGLARELRSATGCAYEGYPGAALSAGLALVSDAPTRGTRGLPSPRGFALASGLGQTSPRYETSPYPT